MFGDRYTRYGRWLYGRPRFRGRFWLSRGLRLRFRRRLCSRFLLDRFLRGLLCGLLLRRGRGRLHFRGRLCRRFYLGNRARLWFGSRLRSWREARFWFWSGFRPGRGLLIGNGRSDGRRLGSEADRYTNAGPSFEFRPGKLAHDLLLTGAYPLVTWAAPLLVGMWIGRRTLSDPVTQWWLFTAGAAVALSTALCAVLVAGEPGSYSLLSNEPHSQMPLWMAGSIGSACAVLGGMLLVADRLPRLVWPLVATGQMVLSVYVGHLLLLSVAAGLFRSEEVSIAFFSVGAFMMVTVICCVVWRSMLPRGPLEMVLGAAWQTVERTVRRHGKTEMAD